MVKIVSSSHHHFSMQSPFLASQLIIVFIICLFLAPHSGVLADNGTSQGFLSHVFSSSLFSPPPDTINSNAIELVKKESCWARPNVQWLIQQYCLGDESLTDEGRAKLTIALSNCHLAASGFDEVVCTPEMTERYVHFPSTSSPTRRTSLARIFWMSWCKGSFRLVSISDWGFIRFHNFLFLSLSHFSINPHSSHYSSPFPCFHHLANALSMLAKIQ